MIAATRALLLLTLTLFLASCAPLSVTFTLGAGEDEFREAVVLEEGGGGGPKVAMIDVRGLIMEGPRPALFGQGPSPVDEFLARLNAAGADPSIQAVVLHINSPGGTVSASDILYTEIRRFREKTGKPVVASIGEIGASGGYYTALAADELIVQPTSITGSIGVIIPSVNISEGLRSIGVVSRSIKSGANKDLANPLEPMRESQYAVLQEMVDEFYARFKGLVLERRPAFAKGSEVEKLTDGRVITGAAAVRSGLADREGDIRTAFTRALALAGASGGTLVKYTPEHGRGARTPYAAAPSPTPQPSEYEVNLVQLRVGAGGGLGMGAPGVAYYVWAPGVGE